MMQVIPIDRLEFEKSSRIRLSGMAMQIQMWNGIIWDNCIDAVLDMKPGYVLMPYLQCRCV